ncbi:MAG TPA: alpha-amylase family glycosyl hydrolase [Solirubrobacteraceae bacterium]|nr:alpha-amylase family glycosyl hydrolase [Solirubrobacteraceae bacterium]
MGDLRGVTAHLDHLNDGSPRSLGVDAIWLSPFYRSPMADFGYDVSDHTDVDPLFGTLADFDELAAQAARRGIRLLVDWVPNHTSDRHPWFAESRSDRESPRRDWYVWRDGPAEGVPPNTWLTAWKEPAPAWTWDEATAQWYLHSFLAQQPDLNWDNPEVEAAMFDVLRFWMDRGAGGFRLDAVYKIGKDPALGDNEPGRSHQEHWPSVHDRLRRLRQVLDEYGDRVAVGEVYADDQRTLVGYVNSGDELHMVHNFSLLHQPWSAAAFREVIAEFTELAEPEVWPAWCLNNHDHPRAASRYDHDGHGPARARVAGMLLLTLRGTPFLYQGEELGMRDALVPPELAVDVDRRDPERAPLAWQAPSVAGPGCGFTTGRPWLPFAPDAERSNVAVQAADSDSTLSLYRRLIWLRRGSAALQGGRELLLEVDSDDVLAYLREAPGERLAVALNFCSDEVAVGTGLAGRGRIEVSTDPARRPGELRLDRLVLRPDEGVLITLES